MSPSISSLPRFCPPPSSLTLPSSAATPPPLPMIEGSCTSKSEPGPRISPGICMPFITGDAPRPGGGGGICWGPGTIGGGPGGPGGFCIIPGPGPATGGGRGRNAPGPPAGGIMAPGGIMGPIMPAGPAAGPMPAISMGLAMAGIMPCGGRAMPSMGSLTWVKAAVRMRSMLEMYSCGMSATSRDSASRHWFMLSFTSTASGPGRPTEDSSRRYFSLAGPRRSLSCRVLESMGSKQLGCRSCNASSWASCLSHNCFVSSRPGQSIGWARRLVVGRPNLAFILWTMRAIIFSRNRRRSPLMRSISC
mmetsp:Transcript_6688/g.17894  ORF Transcript_6688/g.17894 Transcript_6688/m.17894 type:complete len:305 (-) Transcript_6688:154-1068(-)